MRHGEEPKVTHQYSAKLCYMISDAVTLWCEFYATVCSAWKRANVRYLSDRLRCVREWDKDTLTLRHLNILNVAYAFGERSFSSAVLIVLNLVFGSIDALKYAIYINCTNVKKILKRAHDRRYVGLFINSHSVYLV